MIYPAFSAKIREIDGKKRIVLDDLTQYNAFIATLSGDVILYIKKPQKEAGERSNAQNSYYWGVVVSLLSQHTGFTADEMHNALKWKFLRKYKEVDGKVIESVVSTTELSTVEMEEYLKNVREWASADLNMFIPEPNQVGYEE